MGAVLTERDYIGISFALVVAFCVGYIWWRVWSKDDERGAVLTRTDGDTQKIEMRDLERGEGSVEGAERETRVKASSEQGHKESWIKKWIRK